MSWIELKLRITQSALEKISAYLFALGCEGINVYAGGIVIYFSSYRWSEEIKLGMVEYIKQIIPEFSTRDIQIKRIADQDWNKNWKIHFQQIRIGNNIIVVPPWEKYHGQAGQIVITINPQMAFGTGHHESTQLVAMEIEKLLKPGMSVLDIGTGTGILAIISNMLGAEKVIGIDNDPIALKNAINNARINQVRENIHFYVAQLEDLKPEQFDLVLANLNLNVLLSLRELLKEFIKENGKIILSGLLKIDETKMVLAYQDSGFQLVSKNGKKEWLSLIFTPKKQRISGHESRHRYRNEFDSASDWSI
jgi:ribosomal protein L11 methyltransferase